MAKPAPKKTSPAPKRAGSNGNGAKKFETRDGSGSLFKNDRKEKDSHPDYKGRIKVDGTEYWLSAWKKTAATSGATYLSLAIQPMEYQESAPTKGAPADDDDLPF